VFLNKSQFNGVKVLAQDNSLRVQVGANDNETITVDLKEITAATLRLDGLNVAGDRAATHTDLIKDFKATGSLEYSAKNIAGTATDYEVDAATNKVSVGAAATYVDVVTGKLTQQATNGTVTDNAEAIADFAAKFEGKAVGDKATIGGVQWTVSESNVVGAAGSVAGTFTATIDGKTVTAKLDQDAGTLSFTGSSVYFNARTGDGTAVTAEKATWTTHASNTAATLADLEALKAEMTGGELSVTQGGAATTYNVDGAGNITTAAAPNDLMFC